MAQKEPHRVTDLRLAGVLAELMRREPIFHRPELAPDNFLLTYTLYQGERATRRATLWRRHGAAWKIVYHQGTIVEDG